MKNTDARRLSHDRLTDLRKRAVTAVQKGESPEDVARVLGVHRATIYSWLSLYRSGGWGALDARKRGGRRRKLDAKAIAWVYKTVTQKDPRQFKFAFALWTSAMVGGIRLTNPTLAGSKEMWQLPRTFNLRGDRHAPSRIADRP